MHLKRYSFFYKFISTQFVMVDPVWRTLDIQHLSQVETYSTSLEVEEEVLSSEEYEECLVTVPTERIPMVHVDFPTIRQMEFCPSGDFLVGALSNDHMYLFNVTNPKLPKQKVTSRKYGVGSVRFARYNRSANHSVIHTSTKRSDDIRLLCMNTNNYQMYYNGHTEKVQSLSVSPAEDVFFSTSMDKTARFWSCRHNRSLATLPLSTDDQRALCCFDHTGRIIGICEGSSTFKLYDIRKLAPESVISSIKFPEVSREFRLSRKPHFSSMEFSPKGSLASLSRSDGIVFLVDFQEGNCKLRHTLDSITNHHRYTIRIIADRCRRLTDGDEGSCICVKCRPLRCSTSFTPDSQHLICPLYPDGLVCWNVEGAVAKKTAILNTFGLVRNIAVHPNAALMATSNRYLAYWTPLQTPQNLVHSETEHDEHCPMNATQASRLKINVKREYHSIVPEP